MEFRNILVPVDFSEFSDKAVECALIFADRYKARITLAHVILLFHEELDEESRMIEYREVVKKQEARIHQQMKLQFDRAQETDLPVTTKILRGISPADTLIEFIKENNFDLVVMGTHGRTGFKHFVQGSVAEKMVRLSPVPVLTVHRSVTRFHIKRILLPVDFSPFSEYALDYAAAIAETYGAKLILMHVIEQEIYPTFYRSEIESIFEIDRNLHSTVIKNLKELVEDQIDPALVEDCVVLEGPAHKEIVQYAKSNDIDLLVIASHGLTGVEYLLLGSTAEKVTRWATCPVLAVKRSAS